MSTQSPKQVFYRPADRPPLMLTVFSALQHMLLVLSLGLALPVTIARTAGLTPGESGIFLSLALLTIGVTGILQTLPSRYFGNGCMDLSVSDSAALSACTLAAQLGGMPLVYGMTVLSGLFKGILGSFTYFFRKLFPPEVTGCMIFILGISIVPTGLKYFLGTGYYMRTGDFSTLHLFVAICSLLVMLSCTIFSSVLKNYAVLFGIVAGFLLSFAVGIFDCGAVSELSATPVFRIPYPEKFDFAFDWRVAIPFMIVTIAAIVDNIGDYTAVQKISDPAFKRPDWRRIENGIRASGLGSMLAGLTGGVIQSTATANIGIAGATGVTSRVVGYIAGGILIALAFFPRAMGILMLIPEPVLGAVLIFSIAYIMAGGFSALSAVELDDRRIFVIFISIIFAVASMIPGLWTFVPQNIGVVILSPVVMGTVILLVMTVLTSLGTRRHIQFSSAVDAAAVQLLNTKLRDVCRRWCVSKNLSQSLIFGLDAVCEGLCVKGVDNQLGVALSYDRMQVKIKLTAGHPKLASVSLGGHGMPDELDLAIMMLKNRFESVRWRRSGETLTLNIETDL
ncbi:MAG: solute carrier family 23 protein [Victivallaceae bacterium]|nr:solute carrier family 23 protein [Victivallaceae bacterium]